MISEQEFWAALANMPESKPVSWRLYYDESGSPICYSMQEQPGNYIEVDAETYARSPMNIRVVDGQIRYIISTQQQKLVPSIMGTPCDPQDITVVVDPAQPHQAWSRTINETS